MYNYFLKVFYIGSYQRYKKIRRFSPEVTCRIMMDLVVGNLFIMTLFPMASLFSYFGILGKPTMLTYCAFTVLLLLWFHNINKKRIYQATIRHEVKKMSEEEMDVYVNLTILYLVLSVLSWGVGLYFVRFLGYLLRLMH